MNIEYVRGTNVISFFAAGAPVRFPAISQVESYWEGLRNGRLMPTRTEVDPRGVSDALDYAFVLEKIAPGMARIRLAGQHLNTLMGMEVRGMPLTALFTPEARLELQKALGAVFDQPATVHAELKGEPGFGKPALAARMFLAPLRDNRGSISLALGALQSDGVIGRAPRRLRLNHARVAPLVSGVSHFPVERAPQLQGFAETAGQFPERGTEPDAAKKPNLRLVADNDAD